MGNTKRNIKPGTIFISKKIQITVMNVKEGVVQVLIFKSGKSGVIKYWPMEKFFRRTESLEIAPIQSNINNGPYNYKKSNRIKIRGGLIRDTDIILKPLPALPNKYKVKNFFIFAVNEEDQSVLVSSGPNDSDAEWVKGDVLFPLIEPSFLLKISTPFKIDASNRKELKKQAKEIFANLKRSN